MDSSLVSAECLNVSVSSRLGWCPHWYSLLRYTLTTLQANNEGGLFHYLLNSEITLWLSGFLLTHLSSACHASFLLHSYYHLVLCFSLFNCNRWMHRRPEMCCLSNFNNISHLRHLTALFEETVGYVFGLKTSWSVGKTRRERET